MKDYLLLFRGGLDRRESPELWEEHASTKWRPWIDELMQKQIRTDGGALAYEGTVIGGEKKQVTDGPFVESKEIIGGYMLIRANSLKEASGIAKDCPIFIYGGSVEIREIMMKP